MPLVVPLVLMLFLFFNIPLSSNRLDTDQVFTEKILTHCDVRPIFAKRCIVNTSNILIFVFNTSNILIFVKDGGQIMGSLFYRATTLIPSMTSLPG